MERSSFNQLVRFLLRFLLILSLILVFDRGIGMILKHFYFRQNYGGVSRITYVIDSISADILIFGSSRANHSYVPEIFESRLPLTCYNTGLDGNFILYNYAIFKAIVKRYSPKLIIFDISPYELTYHAFEYERLSLLLPYYQKHPEIRYVIDLRGPFEKFKHISTIYFYNSLLFQIARGNLELNKDRVPDLKGYIPLYETMKDEKIGTWKITDCNIDKNKIRALKDIISTCKLKNIDLVFVYSPIWVTIKEGYCDAIVPDLCSGNGIGYLNMSNDSTFINSPDYFVDVSHLNDEGARIFSNMLINKIWHIH
jgi:hypothetical protein